MVKTYKGLIISLPSNGIFVFGSNTQGIHGAGTALIALKKFGAKYGNPKGLQGRSYAIVTKNLTSDIHPSISESDIIKQIITLYDYTEKNPNKEFYIAYTGTGFNLNGYSPREMAKMFKRAGEHVNGGIPKNIVFEEEFYKQVKP